MTTTSRPVMLVTAAYVSLAAVYTWPLLAQLHVAIGSDAGDPVLVASILRWNATSIPFVGSWWSPPFFHPAEDVATFTENFVGLAPLTSPIYWLTRDAVATYNVMLFLTWPLSALAGFFLVRHLTGSDDAAFVGGLAYGFSPYRISELSHLQTLASFGLPIALLGLHRFLVDRHARWLVTFGAAWLLQSLSNGYLMLLGAVLILAWLAFFCSRRETWPAVPPIVAAWALASVPLLIVMLKYQAVHQHYGLRRYLYEALDFSAPAGAWFEVSGLIAFWRQVLPEGRSNLFPGATVVLLVVAGAVASFRRGSRRIERSTAQRALRAVLAAGASGSAAAILAVFVFGSWRLTVGDMLVIRMGDISRALGLLFATGVPLVLLTPETRRALGRRCPLVFYSVAAILMGVFSWGPVLRVDADVVLDPAPYRLLMYLPGFDQLRVPTRFWMLGVLCLATASGLAFARVSRATGAGRPLLLGVVVSGLLLDSWPHAMPMAAPPEVWDVVEPPGVAQPILELPIGQEWDFAATFRSLSHRRKVFNGVSGYDPPHYAPLQAGLNARDPGILSVIASLGSFDIVVDGAADPDGAWTRFVSSSPGAMPIASDGIRTVFRLPAAQSAEPTLGAVLPAVAVTAFRRDAGAAADDRIDTEWGDHPQRPGQWVQIDLGAVRQVGGVTHALGEYARDFPRRLAVDVSRDGATWETVWEGPTAGRAFLAAVREPRAAVMRFAFPARSARFVRVRQVAEHQNMWRVAELRAHAPAPE